MAKNLGGLEYTEGEYIVCPYCGHTYDESFRMVPWDGETHDLKCDGCGKAFEVEVEIHGVTYSCWAKPEEQSCADSEKTE